jgi:hypothetical protein
MIKTHVIWNRELTAGERSVIDERVEQMVQEEKTDGKVLWISDSEDGRIFERTWTTVEAAEEWIAFIETYSPVSVQIIN